MAWFWGIILPTDIIILSLIVISFLAASILFIMDTFPLKQKRTIKEMKAIKEAMLNYKHNMNEYPADLVEIIGSNPVRKEWFTDAWANDYVLDLKKENNIQLMSKGKDGKLHTNDDIIVLITN